MFKLLLFNMLASTAECFSCLLLNTLFYADDLVFISRSKIGLQNCSKHLESFCSTWLLEVNLKKTKIMIFQKCGRKPKNLHFYYQNQLIEIVQEYT